MNSLVFVHVEVNRESFSNAEGEPFVVEKIQSYLLKEDISENSLLNSWNFCV